MTDFWKAVIRPTLKEIRKLPKRKQPLGYLFVALLATFGYFAYLLLSVLDGTHGE